MSIAAIGYLRIAATDTNAWMTFGTDILGLMDAKREDAAGARFLRMDNHPFRFMVESAEQDGLLAAGLELRGRSEWLDLCDRLRAAGHALEDGPAAEAARRCVTAYVTVQDPCGNTLELYYGRRLDYAPLISPVGIKQFITGDEYTGDMGFGHAVLPTPDLDAAASFYTELLGLSVSDTLYPPMPEGAPETTILFMHADNPRQHS
ncbi:MAG: VOC family protein, partial [Haliea sp.]|nr:VOC family protein [Haliea sp.]